MQKALAEALDRAPMGVAIVRDRQILWVNDRLAQWFDMAKNPLAGAALFGGDDRLCIARPAGPLWLRRERGALADGLEAYFFEDVTEQVRIEQDCARLQERVSVLNTKDVDTGLLNRNAILQALERHVSRSRRYGNALSVVRVTLEAPHGAAAETALREFARELNAQLRWADQVGRLDETSFLLILPETGRADAEALAIKLGDERLALAGTAMRRIDCAVASWQKGDDARKLMLRVYPDAGGLKLRP